MALRKIKGIVKMEFSTDGESWTELGTVTDIKFDEPHVWSTWSVDTAEKREYTITVSPDIEDAEYEIIEPLQLEEHKVNSYDRGVD